MDLVISREILSGVSFNTRSVVYGPSFGSAGGRTLLSQFLSRRVDEHGCRLMMMLNFVSPVDFIQSG
jgi:hypothetical protein